MRRNLTYYTGRLVCCTPGSGKINILLETQTKSEIIKNGCRQKPRVQNHLGYNTWSIAPERFPQSLTEILAHENPNVFVIVEDDGTRRNVSVKLA